MQYLVLIDCRSDKTKKAHQPGDVITDKDFPAPVIENWLDIGVLAIVAAVEEQDDGKE